MKKGILEDRKFNIACVTWLISGAIFSVCLMDYQDRMDYLNRDIVSYGRRTEKLNHYYFLKNKYSKIMGENHVQVFKVQGKIRSGY